MLKQFQFIPAEGRRSQCQGTDTPEKQFEDSFPRLCSISPLISNKHLEHWSFLPANLYEMELFLDVNLLSLLSFLPFRYERAGQKDSTHLFFYLLAKRNLFRIK